MSTDYAGLVADLVTILRDAPELADVDVQELPEPPTADHGLAVRVGWDSFDLTPRRIVGGTAAGQTYEEDILLVVDCWAFEGQSAQAAARGRDALVASVRTVLDRNMTLGRSRTVLTVRGGRALTGEGAGIHSGLRLICNVNTAS